MLDDVLLLISASYEQDADGVRRKKENSRKVYCETDSVSATEFYNAGRAGLNPAYRFRIFSYDYHQEPIVEYHGERFSIYRTYKTHTDILELYAERKGGTNG